MTEETDDLRRKLQNAVKKGKAIQSQYEEANHRLQEMQGLAGRAEELASALQAKDAELKKCTANNGELCERVKRLEEALEKQRAWEFSASKGSSGRGSGDAKAKQLHKLNDDLRHQLDQAQQRILSVEEELAHHDHTKNSDTGEEDGNIRVDELRDEIVVLQEALDVAAEMVRNKHQLINER